jgi:hypothetical protein
MGDLDPGTYGGRGARNGHHRATFSRLRQALRCTGKGDGLKGHLEREQQWSAPHSATRVSVEKEPMGARGWGGAATGRAGPLGEELERDALMLDGFALLAILLVLFLGAALLSEYIRSDFGG